MNWGSLDQALLARVMDENARRPEPRGATAIMREAMVTSALESAARAEELGLGGDRIVAAKRSGTLCGLCGENCIPRVPGAVLPLMRSFPSVN